MSGTQYVFFGATPINVAISDPVLNGGVATPADSSCADGTAGAAGADLCGCTVTGGNGLAAHRQGQNPFPALALAPLAAFSAVVFGAGGVQNANPGIAANRDTLVGIVTNSPLAGQPAAIAYAGPVVNTNTGTGGWNFVVNDPVFIGSNGQLTQVAPTSGWIKAVGFAIASDTVMLRLVDELPTDAASNPPNVLVVTPFNNLVLYHDVADVFDVTLTEDTNLQFSGGIDGRSVLLRIHQDSVGGHAFTPLASQFAGSAMAVPLTANSYSVARIMFDASLSKFVVIGFQVIVP